MFAASLQSSVSSAFRDVTKGPCDLPHAQGKNPRSGVGSAQWDHLVSRPNMSKIK